MTGDSDSIDGKFAFGRNWCHFISALNDERIQAAQESMQTLLGMDDLHNRRFLDAGSGSGLFSLSAYRLGANVTSFDVDHDSVACTQELKKRFCVDESAWVVLHGSLTESAFLKNLGEFDVVYCWGVASPHGPDVALDRKPVWPHRTWRLTGDRDLQRSAVYFAGVERYQTDLSTASWMAATRCSSQ